MGLQGLNIWRTTAPFASVLGHHLARPVTEFLDDPDVAVITPRDLRRYISNLRSRSNRYQAHPNRRPVEGGLSTASLAGYGRALRRLFRFTETEGLIVENPARSIRVPRMERGEPKGIAADFTVDELKAAHARYSPVAQLEREGALSSGCQ